MEIFDAQQMSKLDLDFLSISEKDYLKMLSDEIGDLKYHLKDNFSAFEAYYDERRNEISRSQANTEWYNITITTRN